MGSQHFDRRLSSISTVWTVLRDAHGDSAAAARAAQELLVRRYGGAVYRYLLRALGDPAAAEDLAQEFALGLVRGNFRHADPQRGRFRNYVKTALFHLVGKYRKGQRKLPRPVAAEDVERLATAPSPAEFDDDWRNELLARAWDRLADAHPTLYAALRLRAGHPDLSSPELATALGQHLGKPVTPVAVRQLVHRARIKFADLLIDEAAHSLESPSAAAVTEELRDLNLLEYCRPALDRYDRAERSP
jgi:RNA polymerase sigma-70 factor (ECF subfamily)